MNIVWTIIFFICLIAVGGFIFFKIKEKRDREKRRTWIVPLALLDSLLPNIELDMIDAGFGKDDYVSPGHDCSEYAPEWLKRIERAIASFRPGNETEWVKEWSFQRDPYPGGKDAGRHRVVAIKTDAGMKYIDTYRINGSLYRELSETEKQAGYYRGAS